MWIQILKSCLVVAFVGALNHHYSELSDDTSLMLRANPSKLNTSTPYCYHFTWMGSKFNQWTFKSIRNKTCSQYFKDKKTLCINPMVATYKGGKPDLNYILENHANEATCRLSQGHVCVKYTVYFNDIISYETRYCTQINVELEGPMEKGCVYEKKGSQVIEVCACKSQPGPNGICNGASSVFQRKPLLVLLVTCFCVIFSNLCYSFSHN